VVAFARQSGPEWSITVVPRFLTALIGEDAHPLGTSVWQDTVVGLPEGASARWKNVFTHEELTADNGLALGDVLTVYPVALLLAEG
jgi:(1->4)-alpha-D-glucan 1-alpha-D-glucosylmutase